MQLRPDPRSIQTPAARRDYLKPTSGIGEQFLDIDLPGQLQFAAAWEAQAVPMNAPSPQAEFCYVGLRLAERSPHDPHFIQR